MAAADGLFLYEAKAHRLQPVLSDDIRAMTGTQPFVREAAINLVYVADYAKMGKAAGRDKAVLYRPERVPVLHVRGIGDGVPRNGGPGCAREDHETAAGPEDHVLANGRVSEVGQASRPVLCVENDRPGGRSH